MTKIKSMAFFRLMLLLPVLLPLLFLLLRLQNAVGLLMIAAAFGGVQYLFFAAFLWFVTRAADRTALFKLFVSAPILFIPFQLAGVMMYQLWQCDSYCSLSDNAGWLVAFTVYVLLVGYFYVGFASLIYLILNKAHMIGEG